MLRWSDNVCKQPEFLQPQRLDAQDFNPSKRSFPFIDTPTVISGGMFRKWGSEGRSVSVIGGDDEKDTKQVQPFIEVGEDYVTFRLQHGPVTETGVNGCQVDDILTFVLGTIQVFNKKFSCRENALAITKLEECLHWLEERTRDRQRRAVEGRYAE